MVRTTSLGYVRKLIYCSGIDQASGCFIFARRVSWKLMSDKAYLEYPTVKVCNVTQWC